MLIPTALIHLIQVVAVNNPTPFEWLSQHLHLIAWPTIVFFVAKASWYVGSFFQKAKSQIEQTVGQVNTMSTQVGVMSTNHFPHMEKALLNMDKNIRRLTQHTTGEADVMTEN